MYPHILPTQEFGDPSNDPPNSFQPKFVFVFSRCLQKRSFFVRYANKVLSSTNFSARLYKVSVEPVPLSSPCKLPVILRNIHCILEGRLECGLLTVPNSQKRYNM